MKYKLKIKIKYKAFMLIPKTVNDVVVSKPQIIKPNLVKSPLFIPGRLALQS